MPRVRADQWLAGRGLVRSRAQARDLILRGCVTADGKRLERPSTPLAEDADVRVDASGFVSRGGDKLAGALADLGVSLRGRVCVDIGASTGGFTDCALRHGARRVYAVDVGRDQLAQALRDDPRVISREETNARHLTAADFGEPIDVVLVDASFISLDKLLGAIHAILGPGGDLIALVKPQFEAGAAATRRSRGVVRDTDLRTRTLGIVRGSFAAHGFDIAAEADCQVAGPKGNVERFVHARRAPNVG